VAFLQKPFASGTLARNISEILAPPVEQLLAPPGIELMTTDDNGIVTLLVIDDESHILQVINAALAQQGLDIIATPDPEDGLRLFLEKRPEIVLLDQKMPKLDGMVLLEKMNQENPLAEVILMTGYYSAESAVDAVRKGAADYLSKPLDIKALRDRISRLIFETQQRKRAARLDQELVDTFQFEGIVGRSPLMMDVFAMIRRVAPHYRTALITGETGTGKELIAHALHSLSPVAHNRLSVCNCSALVETLLESELFGYVRGAFTGAIQDKTGLFEYAHQGTVFLDEIGDMPLSAQAKLLRVLQNQEVQRVGSPVVRKVDVRVIAATNHDLKSLIQEHKFREDLYYRLTMVNIAVPRLSDRKEDLPLLQTHFVEKYAKEYRKQLLGMTPRAQALLSRHHWPGNVRELENVIGNACMMAESSLIDTKDLQTYLRHHTDVVTRDDEILLSLQEIQTRHLLRVLGRVGGDKTRAAAALGISRTTLYNMLSRIADSPQELNERKPVRLV
jgi:DNA-binding NtrC family response regulator